MAWTKEQQKAIDVEGQNVIVSAGAGSGKTAVLTERVIRKLKGGVHINELLVLTFTNAAALEMKERIRKAINKSSGLEKELEKIDGAYITTFDSFSLSIVKKYHTKLNITNKIKITDEVIIDMEKHKILDTIMDENYLSPKQDFQKLINDFCLKDDIELKEYILNIYKKIELKYDKTDYLDNYIEEYYSLSKIDDNIKEYLSLIDNYRDGIKGKLEELSIYVDGTYIEKINVVLGGLVNASSYEEIKSKLDFRLPNLPKNSDEVVKTIKKEITELVANIKELAIYESISSIKEEILDTRENASVIIRIIQELDKRLTKYKEEHEYYNFTDIANLAIKVVSDNCDVRLELIKSFNEILVDEYQDTSDIQEKFISLISKNNVYMVGDIKQSIYRFRNANPYIFKSKYDLYQNTDAGIKIDLLKNFRSRSEVLEDINNLFNSFMDDAIGGAAYQESHQMVFGNMTYNEQGRTKQNYHMDVLTYKEGVKSVSKEEQEAFIIGYDIREKVNNNYLVFDKDKNVLRKIEYSDFVILLDKSKNFDLYKKIFEYLQIPLTILKDEALRKDQDILVIRNLLKLLICIKNRDFSEEFKYSFISVSRSFLYRLSDEVIYNYFVTNTYFDSELYEKCLDLTLNMDIMSPSVYLKYILEEISYDEKLITIGNVKSFRIRAEYFYNLIKDYEKAGNTIYDFVSYLEEIFKGDYDLKFSVNTASSNSCKIMTIHKSKGLEFPICYFAGLKSSFNMSELREKIIYDNKYGIILPKVDGYFKDTILKTLLKINNKREEISEKIRLLYVAVTRAKEKMIFVLPEQEEIKEVVGLISSYDRGKYNSFLSMMRSVYSMLLPYIIPKEVSLTKDYLDIKSISNEVDFLEDVDSLEVRELEIDSEEVYDSHYSKDEIHIASQDEVLKMEFGKKIHSLLEQIDFTKKDYLGLDEPLDVIEKISAFINSPLIRENLFAKMYKEYEFVYQEDNKLFHGIIDLLIERDDKIIIIDYKLKGIEDNSYYKQINGYKNFIRKKTAKEVECYLYSIIDQRFKRIEETFISDSDLVEV